LIGLIFRGHAGRCPGFFFSMELLATLGTALGLASLSGVNLYLTVLLTGLAVRFDVLDLAGRFEGLAVLGDWRVIALAGVLFLVEFVADKVPYVDSVWDAVHTVIRPVGGALLALAALGHLDPTLTVVAALLFGWVSLTTHGAKATTRLAVNASPEPVSNSVASLAEDGLVLAGFGLSIWLPVLAFFVFLVALALAGSVAAKAWRRAGKAMAK
jgi:hypothetical protein